MSATGDGAYGHRADAGFTLLEMLITVGIMVLITGLVFPDLVRPLQRMPLSEAHAALAANLRAARADAARAGRSMTVQAAQDGRSYGWAGRGTPLPEGIRLQGEAPEIVFFADGSSSGGDWKLADARRTLEVSVDPATGVVDPARAE